MTNHLDILKLSTFCTIEYVAANCNIRLAQDKILRFEHNSAIFQRFLQRGIPEFLNKVVYIYVIRYAIRHIEQVMVIGDTACLSTLVHNYFAISRCQA